MVGRDAAAGGAVAEGMAGGVEYELRLLEEGEPGMGGDGKGDNCSLWVIDLVCRGDGVSSPHSCRRLFGCMFFCSCSNTV